MKAYLNLERAALILIDRILTNNDEKVAAKWGLTPRTLLNYERRLKTDREFSRIYYKRLGETMGAEWKKKAEDTLKTQLTVLNGLCESALEKDETKYIKDISDSVKVVSDMIITSNVLEGDDTE